MWEAELSRFQSTSASGSLSPEDVSIAIVSGRDEDSLSFDKRML